MCFHGIGLDNIFTHIYHTDVNRHLYISVVSSKCMSKPVGARLTDNEYLEIKKLVEDGECLNMADFARRAIRNELERIKRKSQ